MLTVSIPASATHNSFGAQVDIVTPDEVELDEDADETEVGEILPDVARDGPYRLSHYENLEEQGLKVREAPPDQSGARYRASQCTTWESIETANGGNTPEAREAYETALRTGDGCYVGYFDAQWEYMLATNVFLTRQPGSVGQDPISFHSLNPPQDDDHCRGEAETKNRSVGGQTIPIIVGQDSAVDEAITSAERADDPECRGDAHPQYIPGMYNVDTDLLEDPAFTTGAQALGAPDEGSGTISLPLLSTPYLFLFGQPHPDNGNPSSLEAGVGTFGGLNTEGGSPLWDLDGACGERTRDCHLLQPDDIKLFDRRKPDLKDDQARVCAFSHQFSTLNPDQRDAGLCGVFGNVVNQFLGNDTLGGFGVGPEATWINTLPGWHQGAIFTPLFDDRALEAADQYASDPAEGNLDPVEITAAGANDGLPVFTNETEGEIDPGHIVHFAVNPEVPSATHPLWCVRPNMLASGDDALVDSAFDGTQTDPGLYGTYQADAVDSDVYPTLYTGLANTALDATHQSARDVIEDTGVETLADDVTDSTDPEEVPIPEPLNPRETDPADPQAQPGEQNLRPFTDTTPEGVSCTADGLVQAFDEQQTKQGGLHFDTEIAHTQRGALVNPLGLPFLDVDGVNPKDPTTGDGVAPAPESETKGGHWNTETYEFGGEILGVIDSNGNGEFDECTLATGQPQPERDFCPFRALWDTYNPECTSFAGEPCGNLSRSLGYDVEAGVGLFSVLKVTGPVVLHHDLAGPAAVNIDPLAEPNEAEVRERTRVVGEDAGLGAQNCIIAFSTGFGPKLASFVGVPAGDNDGVEGDDTFDDDDRRALCPDQADGPGEIVLIEDGFHDQSGTNRGSFDAAFDFTKILPTPKVLREDLQTGFGAGDELCVHGIWNVREDVDVTQDTNGTLDLGRETDPDDRYRFGDCDPLETGTDS